MRECAAKSLPAGVVVTDVMRALRQHGASAVPACGATCVRRLVSLRVR
jgi:hypothetical protein